MPLTGIIIVISQTMKLGNEFDERTLLDVSSFSSFLTPRVHFKLSSDSLSDLV